MKILAAVVIPPHLSASGAVNAAVNLSQALKRHCEIDLAVMADQTSQHFVGDLRVMKRKSTSPIDFTTGWLPNKYRTLFYRSDIASMVGNYDLVHLHNAIPALEMRRIAQACLKQGIPYVLTTHGFVEILGMQSAYQLNWLHAWLGRMFMMRPLRFVIEHAQRICCLAPQDQALLADLGVPYEDMVVIPNGVSKNFYPEPDEQAMASVCEKFNLPIGKLGSTPVCFFLANHTRNKGLDILLDAFLGSEQPYLLIVGGKKRDYDYEGYQTRVRSGQRIVFTDALTDAEIRGLHHYADLFVFPSRADTLPLVVLEAMAAGRAVLSTRVGGIPFQIDDTCGRLVEPENSSALRQAFEELVAQPQQLAAMGQAALTKVKAQFDWDRSADLTYAVYRETLGLPAAPIRAAVSSAKAARRERSGHV
ncbi:MAG: glycosyltransferase family 4 protein [Pirellulaceae bacterium]|nr:glycosyltransferase family 4 protein [Pirellulaceae bacterium]